MNGLTHVRLLQDAVHFVNQKGKVGEKLAFLAWEAGYGGGTSGSEIPATGSRIIDIVGQESRYTDYYHDLAVYLESVAGNWQDNITEYDGYIFTALNHFLAVPWSPTRWRLSNGYYYFWSPRTGNDSLAMSGKVDYKDAEVDNEHSPVLSRVASSWTSTAGAWSGNWASDIRYTVFAPISALAHYYYERFLFKPFAYVDVNGERFDRINGINLLGPVCHAVADACVPHHTITTMDLKHPEWEGVVQTWAEYQQLADFNLVRQLLDTHMTRREASSGSLRGYLDIDHLVVTLCGRKAYDTFRSQNNLPDSSAMRSPAFWSTYMSNPAKVKEDARYFYNLAIAATVRVLTDACADLAAAGKGTKAEPAVAGVTSYQPAGGIPPLKAASPHPGREPLPDFKVESLLGFKPASWRQTATTLAMTRTTLARWREAKLPQSEVQGSIQRLEDELILQFRKARAAGMKRLPAPETLSFAPQVDSLRKACGLPPVSANQTTRAGFGLATFRDPTIEEASDSSRFRGYLAEAEANAVNGKLLSLTRCIALHKQFLAETPERVKAAKVQAAISGLQRTRDFILKNGRVPPERWPDGKEQMKETPAPSGVEKAPKRAAGTIKARTSRR